MTTYSGYGKDGTFRPRRKLWGALTAGGKFPRFKKWHFFWHFFYGIAAQYAFLWRRMLPGQRASSTLDQDSRDVAARLSNSGYFLIDQIDKKKVIDHYAARIFEKFDAYCLDKPNFYRPKRYVTRKGYLASQAADLQNQLFLESLDPEDISTVKNLFEESGLSSVFHAYYKSNFGVCNVRVWRYFPHDKEGDGKIEPHVDNFPPNILKIMYYRGEIEESSGCLELLDDQGEVFYKVTGSFPTIIFDSNNVRHRAAAPMSRHRDTIEVTLMPRVGGTPVFVDGGYQAGYPLNPFRSWEEPARSIRAF